ncbi:cupredoxin domain-containing protein [Oxyplasma meridianum]|uniref:Cupredoxin domain-containing protein n=1 Tax=Oxyplasma meridianum TaxID=3073602 RepID=A0AAX4NI62_9ARCH
MEGNKGGVTLALVIIVVIALGMTYILSAPTIEGITPTNFSHKYVAYVNLGADANGWDFPVGSYNFDNGTVNPTFYFKVGTLVYFNVTEEDDLPHTLTIGYDGSASSTMGSSLIANPGLIKKNPTSYEITSKSYTAITTSQLTQVPGHTASGKFPFNTAGVYTYWCTVHPTTMYGLIIVNATSSGTSIQFHQLNNSPVPQNCFNSLHSFNFKYSSTIPLSINYTRGENFAEGCCCCI